MIDWVQALSHISGWLGLGAAGTVGFIFLGVFRPQYLFYALIAAVLSGAATFIYAKGAHDDFVLQRQRETTAAQAALDKFAKESAAAERTVRSQPSVGVRDVYDRDQRTHPRKQVPVR